MVSEHERTKKTIWEAFVRHEKLTLVFLLGVVLLGFIAILQMPKESSPEIDFPVAIVTTPFLGASATDVEELVTRPLEDKIKSLTNIDTLTSVSMQGISSITVNFDVDADSLETMTDLRSKVDLALLDLPSDAETPTIQKVSFSDIPILQLAMSGPYSPAELKEFATALEQDIESIGGVSQVNIIGAPNREVRVLVNRAQLDQFGVSLGQVISAISQANINLPVGSIESGGDVYSVRFAGQLFSATDIEGVPVTSIEGSVITVGDMARVIDGAVETGTIARLSVDGSEPAQSISLHVYKVSGGNILDVADAVTSRIDAVSGVLYPDNVRVEVVTSDAEYIRTDLRNLLVNGFETVAIIVVLLMIFLGWREAILASIAVPLTFLMTFIVLGQLGYTINFLTLFSLILALGILVDGAIVVTEGMHGYLVKGKTPKQAAIATIREFQTPLISGTLTTIFVFLPMMMTSGIIGKFIKSIPVTVTIVLISSIIVALGIITTLGSRFLHTESAQHSGKKERGIGKIIARVYDAYSRTLANFLTHTKKRTVFFFTMTALFLGSLSLPVIGVLQVNMFPASDVESFFIDIEKPIGTPLSETDKLAKTVEALLLKDTRIASFVTNVGTGSNAGSMSVANSNTHLGSFTVNLRKDRAQTSIEISEEYERAFETITTGNVKVAQQSSGPEQGAPVNVQVHGDNLDTLDIVAGQVADLLETVPGARNVELSTKESNGEFVLSIDRAQARFYGVSTADVASLLRSAVTGNTATVLKKDGDDIDVIVRYDLDTGSSGLSRINTIDIDTISSLTITTPKGDIPLASFLSSDLGVSRPLIRHEDAERLINVTSQVQDGYQAQQIVSAFQKKAKTLALPDGYTLSYGGESESINKSFADMFKAMFVGMFMIAGLLIWQFRSYRQPLFVLSSIPLSLIGVFPGLVLVGEAVSFPSFIGIVALAGIVVNNAIILIDRINENRTSNGMSIDDAITEAASSRLQPILLTTMTTVAGILPLALTNPSWGPLGYSIVFGLLFSTVLTLFMVPLLYQRFGEKELDVA
jgi:multidrug efflux pump